MGRAPRSEGGSWLSTRQVTILVADAQNHGAVTIGGSVLEAFDRMEVLENTAKVHLGAISLGGVTPIDGAGIRQIEAAFL